MNRRVPCALYVVYALTSTHMAHIYLCRVLLPTHTHTHTHTHRFGARAAGTLYVLPPSHTAAPPPSPPPPPPPPPAAGLVPAGMAGAGGGACGLIPPAASASLGSPRDTSVAAAVTAEDTSVAAEDTSVTARDTSVTASRRNPLRTDLEAAVEALVAAADGAMSVRGVIQGLATAHPDWLVGEGRVRPIVSRIKARLYPGGCGHVGGAGEGVDGGQFVAGTRSDPRQVVARYMYMNI